MIALATEMKAKELFLKRLTKSSYIVVHEQWRNIHFTNRGIGRLAHICGFLEALELCGKSELAEAMAADICGKLDWLNEYGGESEFAMEYGVEGKPLRCPRYRVVLSDDGTFGGFGVLWFHAVDPKTETEARQAMPLGDDERFAEWRKRLADANSWRTELELWRCYEVNYSDRRESTHIQYRYSFNGGLLFHGLGNDPTAVVLGDCKYWSIHT